MGISENMDEFSRLKPDHLSDHHRQKCIGSNIERYPQESICGSLVHLTGKFPVCHIELEHHVTWGQEHTVRLHRIIGHDEHTARVRVLLQSLDYILYLIDSFIIEIPPLEPIHWTKIAMRFRKYFIRLDLRDEIRLRKASSLLYISLVRPFIPDMHVIIHEIFDISFSSEKPEKFMDNPLQKDFLGRQKWESFREIKPHLATENAPSSSSGPVTFVDSLVHDFTKKVEVLLFALRHDSVD